MTISSVSQLQDIVRSVAKEADWPFEILVSRSPQLPTAYVVYLDTRLCCNVHFDERELYEMRHNPVKVVDLIRRKIELSIAKGLENLKPPSMRSVAVGTDTHHTIDVGFHRAAMLECGERISVLEGVVRGLRRERDDARRRLKRWQQLLALQDAVPPPRRRRRWPRRLVSRVLHATWHRGTLDGRPLPEWLDTCPWCRLDVRRQREELVEVLR